MRLIDAGYGVRRRGGQRMKITGVEYEDGHVIGIDVLMDGENTQRFEPVRHGHWKDKRRYEIGPCVDDDGWVELQELCSACNMWVITDWRSPEYCSKCGTQMRKGSE